MQQAERRTWVEAKLDNWATWATERASAGLGYPKSSACARMGGRAACTGNVIPVDAIDAERTQRAMDTLRFEPSLSWITIHHQWLGDPRVPWADRKNDMTIPEIAASLCCSERTVRNRIDAGLMFLACALSMRN